MSYLAARKLCDECKPGQTCKEQFPIQFDCAVCDGKGCDECHEGVTELHGCPYAECVDEEMVSLAQLGNAYKQAILPTEGGLYDQSQLYVDMVQFWCRELDRAQAEK